ncbi:MAG: hypothetical protein HON90_08340 [Halobacteriovoraceae bacterium]|nr:hypothetical protein [Halobacteriovoraceae bacterium]
MSNKAITEDLFAHPQFRYDMTPEEMQNLLQVEYLARKRLVDDKLRKVVAQKLNLKRVSCLVITSFESCVRELDRVLNMKFAPEITKIQLSSDWGGASRIINKDYISGESEKILVLRSNFIIEELPDNVKAVILN